MRFSILGLLFSLFLTGCSSTHEKSAEEKARLHTNIGTELLGKGKYPQALKHLLQADTLNPNNAVTKNSLGLNYYVFKKYKLAANNFKDALNIEPNYTEARNNLARTYIEMGLYNRAITELKKTLNDLTYDKPQKSWANLSLAHFRKGDLKEARKAIRNSLSIDKNNCDNNVLYGKILFQSNKFKSSAKVFDISINYCPKEVIEEPLYFSGLSYYKIGNREKTKSRLNELSNKFPDSEFTAKAKKQIKW